MTKSVSEVEKKSQDSKSLQTPKEALYVTKDRVQYMGSTGRSRGSVRVLQRRKVVRGLFQTIFAENNVIFETSHHKSYD